MILTRNEMLAPMVSAIDAKLSDFDGWDVRAVEVEGEAVATLIYRGTEVHFAIRKGWKPKVAYRKKALEMLAPVFEYRGFLTTKILKDRVAQQEFVTRVGFKPTWEDEQFIYYILTELPFQRKQS